MKNLEVPAAPLFAGGGVVMRGTVTKDGKAELTMTFRRGKESKALKYKFDTEDATVENHPSVARLEAYDNDVVEVTISGRHAVYSLDTNLYDGRPRIGSSGLLEVFHAGEWRGVCDDNFTAETAQVACREMGMTYGNFTTNQQGSGRFWIDDIRCTGNEARLSACVGINWGVHNCSASEHVALRCQ